MSIAIRKRIEHDFLPTALDSIVSAMNDSKDEKLRFEAAKWICEQVLGKPKQAIDPSDDDRSLALTLAHALREAISQRNEALMVPIVDGSVRILGDQPELPAPTLSDDDFPDA